MSELVRFGVAIERSLLEAFDAHIERRKYETRSEARDCHCYDDVDPRSAEELAAIEKDHPKELMTPPIF